MSRIAKFISDIEENEKEIYDLIVHIINAEIKRN